MKKALLFIIVFLLIFVSCSKEDENNSMDVLSGTVWKQDIGDKTHWFSFYDQGTLHYVEAAFGDNPYNYLSQALAYSIDKNNVVTISIFASPAVVDNTVWLSGNLRENKLYLNGDNQIFELTKYQLKK